MKAAKMTRTVMTVPFVLDKNSPFSQFDVTRPSVLATFFAQSAF